MDDAMDAATKRRVDTMATITLTTEQSARWNDDDAITHDEQRRETMASARRLAEQTGSAVEVCDTDGIVLECVRHEPYED
jgi:D-alanyl-D-alanine carboxypeptidase